MDYRFTECRVELYNPKGEILDVNVVQMTMDASAILSITDKIQMRVSDVEGNVANVLIESDKIQMEVSNLLNEVENYSTLFQMTDRLITLTAAVFDKDQEAIQECGLFVKPDGAGLYAQSASGNVSTIGVEVVEDGTTKVKLTGDNIQLEGVVTANDNFKVLRDGSIETKNAKLMGYLYQKFVPIDLSDATDLGENEAQWHHEYLLNTNLYVDATFCGVVLPVSAEYEGARVLIMDSHFVKSRVATPPTRIRTSDGSEIISGYFKQSRDDYPTNHDIFSASSVTIDSGTAEFILMNYAEVNEETGQLSTRALRWIMIGNSAQNLSFVHGNQTYYYQWNTDN